MTKPRVLLLSLLFLGLPALTGCGFYNEEEQAEYDRVYAATQEVLGRYFNVKESMFQEGHLITYSRISNQFGEQQRYKIDTWIDRDTEGFFEPHVVVVEEMNLSIAQANKISRAQDDPVWRAVGFNRKLSTQLTNEIYDAIGGHTKALDADWFDTDLQLIERQKKIDEAREGYMQDEAR